MAISRQAGVKDVLGPGANGEVPAHRRPLRPGELSLRVTETDPSSDARWARFVASHPQAFPYHHPAWMRVLEREYPGASGVHLVCEDSQGELRGILPLVETRGVPLRRGHRSRRRLSSLPRTPVCGPLALDCSAADALVRAASERALSAKRVALELKLPTDLPHPEVDGALILPWREAYYLTLPERGDQLRFGNSRNHARITWAVRRAEKLGVRLRQAETIDDVRAWYSIYLATMRAHVVPPRPYRLFEAMWEELNPRGLMRFLLAERHDSGGKRLLSGSIFLMCGQTVTYAYNGRTRDADSMRSNELIMSGAIRLACEEGYRRFDFGEVPMGNDGLASFKGKWGSSSETLYRLYHPAPNYLERDEVGSVKGMRRIGQAVWRRTPLRLTAKLGDRFYTFM